MAGDAATKAASKVNPSQDALSNIDKPAPDNTWHETPNLSKDNLKNQFKTAVDQNKPVSKQDLKDAAGDASQSADPSGSRDPTNAADRAARDQQQGGNSGVDAQSGARSGIDTLKNRADTNVDDKTKEAARTYKQKANNYLANKMPEERKEQIIWRLKKMVVEIQGHPDYMEAIDTLLNLAETYGGHANTVAQQGAGTVQDAHGDTALKSAEKDMKLLLERFANGTSSNDLFDALNMIYKDADQDPELKKWFKSVDAYVRKCLKQQGYIMEDAANDEYGRLYDQGNFLLRDRYRNHTDRIVDEAKFLGDQFDKDPQNRRFAESVQKLFNDLGNDENGKPTFKPHLLKDLSEVILPAAFEHVAYVPIPRIEYSDPMMDAVIENLVIESDNLMPNVFMLESNNHFRWGRKGVANKNKNDVMIKVSGVQCDLRDVSYYIKKKQGFPSITDLGVADIFLGGDGFSFDIRMATAEKKDRQNFFKVSSVNVDVKNFNIKFKQSKHKLLLALAKPIMLKVIRPGLQKALEQVIKQKFTELDNLCYQIKLEADRAAEEVKRNPEQASNIYQRYASAAQKQLMQGKQKAKEVQESAADKKVNMAVTKHDSIFPDISLPGGISSKATEYKEMAAKGEKWESPVFGIGSASKSTNIPSAGEPSRKPHDVTSGGVNGAQNVGNTSSMTEKSQANGGTTGYDGTNSSGAATNGTSGFSNSVDQAFSQPKTEHLGTTLGANNPVYNGTSA